MQTTSITQLSIIELTLAFFFALYVAVSVVVFRHYKSLSVKSDAKRSKIEKRFSKVISAEVELRSIKSKISHLSLELVKSENEFSLRTSELSASYETTKTEYKRKLITLKASFDSTNSRLVNAESEAKAKLTEIAEGVSTLDSINAAIGVGAKTLDNMLKAAVQSKSECDKLEARVAELQGAISLTEIGVYNRRFEFDDPWSYKSAIERAQSSQKELIASGTAVVCPQSWLLNGSTAQGKGMIDKTIKLALRAFNGEADAAIASARWNNIDAMDKRIRRAREQIDKLNVTYGIAITDDYLNSKLKELYLTHEHRLKVREDKESQAESRKAAKEEERLQRDLAVAEENEARIQRTIDKTKSDIAKSSDLPQDHERIRSLQERIKILENDLGEAHAKVERAQSLAEKTRTGYVYIISNIGSFGKDVVKIGLTRRLDPMDRVRELGDASVPFTFDTHAMIYSDDAPTLEKALHSEFEATRVNTQNFRKEFFRVSIRDVEMAVKRLAPNADFFSDIEAQEFHESLARRQITLGIGNSPSLASTTQSLH